MSIPIPDNIEDLITAVIDSRTKEDHSVIAAFMACMEAMARSSSATFQVTVNADGVTVSGSHPSLNPLTFTGEDAPGAFRRAMGYFANLGNLESDN